MRTDTHNNPAAITSDVAQQGGLVPGKDFTVGDPFFPIGTGSTLYTARLIGDPVALTIRVIDIIGYYTKRGAPRWTYIAIPAFVWNGLTEDGKRDVIGFHYLNEGGTAMRPLFPNYGRR